MPELTERLSLDYKNLSEIWCRTVPNYTKQYCNIYLVRLQQMTELLEKQIQQKWGNTYTVCKLHKLPETNYKKCVVIGTLFKNQKLKPSILKRLAEGNQLVPQPILTHFTDASDELYIEDELQRYLIVGSFKHDKLVTGISCALLGTGDEKGRFLVDDVVFAGLREQIEKPIFKDLSFVVFLSGLDLINSSKFLINLQLLTYWLSGLAGDLTDVTTSKITRLIIAGNSIRNTPEPVKPSISMLSRQTDSRETFETVKQFDQFLFKLSQTIDVDIMPGGNDPSNHILPQKPMHYCMFPESSVYKTINQVSNPYYCSVGGVRIMGSSGQPVHDVMRFTEITDPLEVLESCLKWNHLAPTAPDTLGCFPFYEKDLFVLEDCPHLLFAGNQKEFGTRTYKGEDGQMVTLLSIPEFCKTFQACVLDLKTLNCNPISFQTC